MVKDKVIMKIEVKIIAKKPTYRIGKLYIDGVFFCNTLEDTDRGLTQDMNLSVIQNIKVKGKTAIPTGTYSILMDTVSPKFSKYKQYDFCGGKLPRLQNVPGFEGILIHIGNTPEDSDGCILVGKNTEVGKVTNSTETFKQLYAKMKDAADKGEEITITIS